MQCLKPSMQSSMLCGESFDMKYAQVLIDIIAIGLLQEYMKNDVLQDILID